MSSKKSLRIFIRLSLDVRASTAGLGGRGGSLRFVPVERISAVSFVLLLASLAGELRRSLLLIEPLVVAALLAVLGRELVSCSVLRLLRVGESSSGSSFFGGSFLLSIRLCLSALFSAALSERT